MSINADTIKAMLQNANAIAAGNKSHLADETARIERHITENHGEPLPTKEPKPYIVEVPLDLHELWATCGQDLVDTMPGKYREQIVEDES